MVLSALWGFALGFFICLFLVGRSLSDTQKQYFFQKGCLESALYFKNLLEKELDRLKSTEKEQTE